MTVAELVEAYDLIGDDWEERYGLLLDLGRKLPAMPEEAKIEENRVHGCQSKVWVIAREEPGSPPKLEFLADADAAFVRGEIGILLMVYSHRTSQEILQFDIDGLFARLGLDRHLTPARSNGLHSMVKKIQGFARNLQEQGHLS